MSLLAKRSNPKPQANCFTSLRSVRNDMATFIYVRLLRYYCLCKLSRLKGFNATANLVVIVQYGLNRTVFPANSGLKNSLVLFRGLNLLDRGFNPCWAQGLTLLAL